MEGSWISLSHPGDAVAFRTTPPGVRAVRLMGTLHGLLRIDAPMGSASIPSSGDFDVTLPLELAPGDEAYVRAETGELRLARIEVLKDRPQVLSFGASPHLSLVRNTSK